MKSGIYKITSPINKVYIGQSIDIDKRYKDYKSLKSKLQKLLHRSFLKYGVDNHIFEVVEECSIELLNERERYWQEYYDVLNVSKGLNLKYTETFDRSGILSESSKKKISIGNSGKIRTKEHKLKTSESLKEFYTQNEHHLKGFKRGTCNNKLKKEQVLEIRLLLKQGKKVLEISKLFNVSKATIQQIKEGRTWQSLGEFKLKGKAEKIESVKLKQLFRCFELKYTYNQITNLLGFCVTTIAKYKKIWKQQKKE